jgi:hypothetical protein
MQPSNLVNKGSEGVQVQAAPFTDKVRRAWQGQGSCRSLRLSWLSVAADLVVVVMVSAIVSWIECSSLVVSAVLLAVHRIERLRIIDILDFQLHQMMSECTATQRDRRYSRIVTPNLWVRGY